MGAGETLAPPVSDTTGLRLEAIVQSFVVVKGPPGRSEPWTWTSLIVPWAAIQRVCLLVNVRSGAP
jgi:hypothetical protein